MASPTVTGSFNLHTKSSESPNKINTMGKFFMAQVIFRVLAIVFTLTAVSVTVTSKQTISMYGILFSAYYTSASAFRFLLGVNVAVCAFSAVSLIYVCAFGRSDSKLKKDFLLFLHDLVIMVLMISGCAAATAVGFVGRYGQELIGWLPVCNEVEKFCQKITISIVFSYLAFFSFLILTIMSAKKFKSGAIE